MQNDNSKFKMESRKSLHSVDGGFLQSEHWAKFQEGLGRKVTKIEDGDFKALMIFYSLPLVGGYFFVPRGPILKNQKSKIKNQNDKFKIKYFLDQMVEKAKKENAGWVRVEPQTKEDLDAIKEVLRGEYKIVKSKKNHEPAQTVMIDLEKNEDELLLQMKSKTRYNVRLAAKRGVELFSSRSDEHIEKFIELIKITAERDKITSHENEYYRKMIKAIPDNVLNLYFAKYQGEIISSIMISFFGGVATYLHGASANEHRNVMAPFALQWQAIQGAKQKGCKRYDLGGTRIPSTNYSLPTTHYENWQGITRFKVGFCPSCEPIEFPGCWDIVLDSKKYQLYKILQWGKDIMNEAKK